MMLGLPMTNAMAAATHGHGVLKARRAGVTAMARKTASPNTRTLYLESNPSPHAAPNTSHQRGSGCLLHRTRAYSPSVHQNWSKTTGWNSVPERMNRGVHSTHSAARP